MKTRSEQLTEHFYRWEGLGRGGVLFDDPVHLEPVYLPFSRDQENEQEYIDDGKVPSLLSRIFSLAKGLIFDDESHDRTQEKQYPLDSNFDTPDRTLVGLKFCFQRAAEISPRLFIELFSTLSHIHYHLSFEIVASSKSVDFQLVGASTDIQKAGQHIKAIFPHVVLHPFENTLDLPFTYDEHSKVAVAEMAPEEEYMRPLQTARDFSVEPLTSIITTLEHLQEDERAMIQILFAGVKHPWKYDMLRSVSDGRGGSFFQGDAEMLPCTKEKVSDPLFSCVIRLAAQSGSTRGSEALAIELAQHLSRASDSSYNKLVMLPNEGYEYHQHVANVFYRKSNRWGFFINSRELAQLAHYPNKSNSSKLGFRGSASKPLPKLYKSGSYKIGVNIHHGEEHSVFITDEMRLRHTHIIGATGVGKSTMIAHLIGEDMNAGNGCALFDPHGDIVECVIGLVPPERIKDVILIDPSDSEHPIGFNLLNAETEAEKMVLSSDLVSAFMEHSTSWGDQMTSVLSNAINTFLYSTKGGTLIELKRLILEKKFRDEFLSTVEDPSILYYWEHDFPMLKKGSLSPLLTRIDTFLRPAIIRYMLAQKEGVNIKQAIDEKKIVLIKLSQGLIGEDNSHLLAAMFLAKVYQAAQGRQVLSPEERHPYYVYLDEFQNFLTPSISHILSGARKYGLGLILAHQELSQIGNSKILGSVISNPFIRICYRLGTADAKRLESGFHSFDATDFQSLSTGEAIMRIGGSSNDFNIRGFNTMQKDKASVDKLRNEIVAHTRFHYGSSRKDVEAIIEALLPRKESSKKSTASFTRKQDSEEPHHHETIAKKQKDQPSTENRIAESLAVTNEVDAEEYDFKSVVQDRNDAQTHQKIQRSIKKMAQDLDFLTTIEMGIEGAKRIDVFLERPDVTIAVEVSVSNTVSYEIENIRKCLSHASHIVMISPNGVHLENIKEKACKVFEESILKRIHFLSSESIKKFLESFKKSPTSNQEKTVNGYRIKTTESKTDPKALANKMSELIKVLSTKGKKK